MAQVLDERIPERSSTIHSGPQDYGTGDRSLPSRAMALSSKEGGPASRGELIGPRFEPSRSIQMNEFDIPETMKAWVLGNPDELALVRKPVPLPGLAEVLVRVDAVAICATDLEIISHGVPASVDGELPFNRNFTPGHEYMGTVLGLGATVDEYAVGDRVAVEAHAGCGRCERCRQGMYTSCLNYGANFGEYTKGHRANGFTTDGAFAEYAVNHVNTLVRVPDSMTDEEAALISTAGTAMYGLDVLGGLVAGESLAVIGAGPVGLLGVALGKALGASPVILIDIVEERLQIGTRLGADHVVDAGRETAVEAVRRLSGGRGVNLVFECSGAPDAVDAAVKMVSRGGRVCLSAFSPEPSLVDIGHIVTNNIYLFGIRGEGQSAMRRAAALMAQNKVDASLILTHTFPMHDLPTALRYAQEKIDGAIKVVMRNH
jgi:L-iditol 2-dehydrogenase